MTVVVPAVPFGHGRAGQVRHARSLVEMADNACSAGGREAAELLIARAYAAYDLASTIPATQPRRQARPRRFGHGTIPTDENEVHA